MQTLRKPISIDEALMKNSGSKNASCAQRFWLTAICCALLFFSVSNALAYLPSTKTILNRTARKDIKGLYQIEQDVIFQAEPEPLVIREKWTVENGENMRLSAAGPKSATPFRYESIYKDGKKHYVDADGETKSVSTSPEFTESILHYRSGKAMIEALIRMRILPQQALQDRKVMIGGKPQMPSTDPWLRLARVGGTIAWAFGEATPIQAEKQMPGLWIEQDSFLFKKLRYQSQAEVAAEKSATFAGGMRFPRERTVSWDNNQVLIRIVAVKPVSDGGPNSGLLNPSSLNSSSRSTLPDLPSVREFYSRFR